MVLDSSAIIAIELSRRRGQDAGPWLRSFLRNADAEVVPFTEEHLDAAIDAFLRFGKGRHRAALNFGDCMAYALARETGEELLFKGTDFAQTDIAIALY